MAGSIHIHQVIPVVLIPIPVFKLGLLEMPDQRFQVRLATRVQLVVHDVALGLWDEVQEPTLCHQNFLGDVPLKSIVVTCKIWPRRTVSLRKKPFVVRQLDLSLGQCLL